jgi:hypothetical protein
MSIPIIALLTLLLHTVPAFRRFDFALRTATIPICRIPVIALLGRYWYTIPAIGLHLTL